MGSLYQRGNIWWIKYYRNGKPYYESSKGESETKAERLLKRREGEIAKGELPGIYFDKIHFSELAEDYLTDYRVNGKKTLDDAERNVKRLAKFFGAEIKEIPAEEMEKRNDGRRLIVSGGKRVTEISTAKVKEFIESRLADGLSNASVNRELAALKAMFNLAAECTPPKVARTPYIPMLQERNVRKGFFEYEEFQAFRNALPDYLQDVVTFAYHTGWRKEEILGLAWDKMDLKAGIVRLDPGETKNDEARTVYLNEELLKMLRARQAQRRLGCNFVFHHNGEKIGDFRKTWETAFLKSGLGAPYVCEDCGNAMKVIQDVKKKDLVCSKCKGKNLKWAGKIFHDFRRSGVRNMIRAGIPERVAMKISGHKTRSVFDRYNIVSQEDLREAARKQEVFLQAAKG